jgi:hypothetical protein
MRHRRPTGVTLCGIALYAEGLFLLRVGLGSLLAREASLEQRVWGILYFALAFSMAWVATGLLTMLRRARVQTIALCSAIIALIVINALVEFPEVRMPLIAFAAIHVGMLAGIVLYLSRNSVRSLFTPKPSVDASLAEPSNA